MTRKRIGIVGLGYVGRTMHRLFGYGEQFELVTYDIATDLIDQREAFAGCDLALICVPTPMQADGAADISAVLEVAEWLPDYAGLIVIKSTVPPGTTDGLNCYEAVGKFHFSPEYSGEGRNYVAPWRQPDPRDAKTHDFCIVGGPTPDLVLAFFQKVMATDARYIGTSARAAELAKYAENAFLATKLRFCFELAEIAEAFGVSYNQVRDLWLCDSRVGASHTLVHPDQHYFSGKCLPKDLSALVNVAKALDVAVPLLAAVSEANEWERRQAEAK